LEQIRKCGDFSSTLPDEEAIMNFKAITLALAFALSSTVALAQAGGANGAAPTLPENSARSAGSHSAVAPTDHGTTGMSRKDRSLKNSGGPSTTGGDTPGATNK
jgi:hypothetical protein